MEIKDFTPNPPIPDLTVLFDILTGFDLSDSERAEIFHAYDTAPDGIKVSAASFLASYHDSPAHRAWKRARKIRLRVIANAGAYGTTLADLAGTMAPTKMQILTALSRAEEFLSVDPAGWAQDTGAEEGGKQ